MPKFLCAYFWWFLGGELCIFLVFFLTGDFPTFLMPAGGLFGHLMCSLVIWVFLWLSSEFCSAGLLCLILFFVGFSWWSLFYSFWAWVRMGWWLLGLGGFPEVAWLVFSLDFLVFAVVVWCVAGVLVSDGSVVGVVGLSQCSLIYFGSLGFAILAGCVWCLLSDPLWFCGAMMMSMVATRQGFSVLWTFLISSDAHLALSLPLVCGWHCAPLSLGVITLISLIWCYVLILHLMVGWVWRAWLNLCWLFVLFMGLVAPYGLLLALYCNWGSGLYFNLVLFSWFCPGASSLLLPFLLVQAFLDCLYSCSTSCLDCSAGFFPGFPGRSEADAEKRLIYSWIAVF